ncbi:MAG: riboflavin synthase [Firmicutes bacterium]|nr:riboflavin synthase [Alicyclobacillaceae bacterium]MCL6497159.1 riboflavin synthase [Bacillota bacterium]
MFTGLVEAVGVVVDRRPEADATTLRLAIAAPWAEELTVGESVAVSGVCLTVVEGTRQAFWVQCSSTTLARTTLGTWEPGHRCNLERAPTPSTRLGGHYVLGHVDAVGTILAVEPEGLARRIRVGFPPEFGAWVVPRGSVAVDGVSLTVVECGQNWLAFTVIPHTQAVTTLGALAVDDRVHLEFDLIAKYLASWAEAYGVAPPGQRPTPESAP